MSLSISVVSPEPSLLAKIKFGCRSRLRPKLRNLATLYVNSLESIIAKLASLSFIIAAAQIGFESN